jgi:hypothetical protein
MIDWTEWWVSEPLVLFTKSQSGMVVADDRDSKRTNNGEEIDAIVSHKSITCLVRRSRAEQSQSQSQSSIYHQCLLHFDRYQKSIAIGYTY